MGKLAYVVLHYITIELTKNCVDSILKKSRDNYYIVIVDNGSTNGTGEKLQELYKDNNEIIVILSNENLGFAKGNNLGIEYAKDILKAEFVCCLNNDTLLIQNNFHELIKKEFNKSNAAIIGPEIILNDGSVQKFPEKLRGIEHYRKELAKLKKEDSMKDVLKNKIMNMNFFEKIIILRKKHLYRDYNNQRKENVIVHGCCIIFTPAFFEKMKGLDPRTFMYREEAILFVQLKKNRLKSVYLPSIKIRHLEGVSTNAVYKKSDEKIKFVRNTKAKSVDVLISEMEESITN
ncbi:Glycosyltransferase, GT2 family [Desemzia incerta]|uniref:Glycosyltransferase, GT2 family n=1 Tax=Desemzia incerta TaxID=82801 RepID=A0A1I5X5N1_9LACT|nr:glycosyltransferase [Desemzia incerta]SFQ27282.1 Glycosyltransferase, GT2 family [Desemzia incerta]